MSNRLILLIPVVVLVTSGISMYSGAALAIELFSALPPWIVAWLRISVGALLLLLIARPHRDMWTGRAGVMALIYGLTTLGMNTVFYEAIARIPLGTAVAIEFLGPVAVAAWGSKTARDWLSLLLAAIGVVVMSEVQWQVSPVGVVFILLSALLWAGYLIVSARVALSLESGSLRRALAPLAVGFTYAGVLAVPLIIIFWPEGAVTSVGGGGAFALWALGLGFFSSVVPYGLDQLALTIASKSYYAVLSAILPLTALLVGALLLQQMLSVPELIGVILIVIAVVLRKPVAAEE
ncbi:MAG: EamA family transporter [Corynebacterium sp.]|nr:EamA family transporter [Corynebacterium sp.]